MRNGSRTATTATKVLYKSLVQNVHIFDDLGASIESRWRDKNYSEEAFPDMAYQALADARLPERITAWDTIRWVQSAPQLPTQHDVEGRFGNPPITLYSGPRFYIDIYFWVDGTTDIHQHAFDGAFQVLLGSSIHSRYSFQEQHFINEKFLLGQIVFDDSELLRVGDIRKIISGQKFIHSLFHLDRPSATITVRTYGAVTSQPQYSYLKPHIAFDPFFKEPSAIKKLQSVSLLLGVQHENAEKMISDLLSCADFQTTLSVLQLVYFQGSNELERAMKLSKGEERFQRLLGTARRRHGKLVDFIPPVLEEQQRIDDLVKRRQSITSREHRFFLALLLNVPSRAKVLELVRQDFPVQDPVETVLDWVEQLSTTKVWGSSEPNVLGIENLTDDHLLVLEGLLRGLSPQQRNSAVKKKNPSHARTVGSKLDPIAQLRASSAFRSILAG